MDNKQEKKNQSKTDKETNKKHEHIIDWGYAENIYHKWGSYWADFRCLDCGKLIEGIPVNNMVGQ